MRKKTQIHDTMHQFNNLLFQLSGQIELLIMDTPIDSNQYNKLIKIKLILNKVIKLTQQLTIHIQ